MQDDEVHRFVKHEQPYATLRFNLAPEFKFPVITSTIPAGLRFKLMHNVELEIAILLQKRSGMNVDHVEGIVLIIII